MGEKCEKKGFLRYFKALSPAIIGIVLIYGVYNLVEKVAPDQIVVTVRASKEAKALRGVLSVDFETAPVPKSDVKAAYDAQKSDLETFLKAQGFEDREIFHKGVRFSIRKNPKAVLYRRKPLPGESEVKGDQDQSLFVAFGRLSVKSDRIDKMVKLESMVSDFVTRRASFSYDFSLNHSTHLDLTNRAIKKAQKLADGIARGLGRKCGRFVRMRELPKQSSAQFARIVRSSGPYQTLNLVAECTFALR